MNKEKVIKRIQKLLSMAGSKSYNPNEASVAAKRAQELLDKYNINISEVEAKEVTTVDVELVQNRIIDDWKMMLADAMQTAFGIRSLILSTRPPYSGQGIRFVGGEVDVEVAKYTYDFLVETVDRLYEEGEEEISYKMGVASSICAKLRAMGQEEKEKQAEKKNEIIFIKGRAIQDYLAEQNIQGATPQQRQQVTDQEALRKGYKAGEGVEIRKGIV